MPTDEYKVSLLQSPSGKTTEAEVYCVAHRTQHKGEAAKAQEKFLSPRLVNDYTRMLALRTLNSANFGVLTGVTYYHCLGKLLRNPAQECEASDLYRRKGWHAMRDCGLLESGLIDAPLASKNQFQGRIWGVMRGLTSSALRDLREAIKVLLGDTAPLSQELRGWIDGAALGSIEHLLHEITFSGCETQKTLINARTGRAAETPCLHVSAFSTEAAEAVKEFKPDFTIVDCQWKCGAGVEDDAANTAGQESRNKAITSDPCEFNYTTAALRELCADRAQFCKGVFIRAPEKARGMGAEVSAQYAALGCTATFCATTYDQKEHREERATRWLLVKRNDRFVHVRGVTET